ncbi:hypothetical protein GCM10027040_07380 [Halomonas shantousis]
MSAEEGAVAVPAHPASNTAIPSPSPSPSLPARNRVAWLALRQTAFVVENMTSGIRQAQGSRMVEPVVLRDANAS